MPDLSTGLGNENENKHSTCPIIPRPFAARTLLGSLYEQHIIIRETYHYTRNISLYEQHVIIRETYHYTRNISLYEQHIFPITDRHPLFQ